MVWATLLCGYPQLFVLSMLQVVDLLVYTKKPPMIEGSILSYQPNGI